MEFRECLPVFPLFLIQESRTAAERARLVKRIQNRGADEFRLVRYLVQSRKHLAFRLEGNDSLFFLTHDSLHLFNRLKVIQSNTK